ncbi:MAG: transcription elongation factor GreA [Alphaproteobacteria bacterium]|nr:transcription elongation factor GreA [Alphaproteobacteria bacterium]NDC55983.1 transcription elongation factor GreA [Alphaproteobacteria bacterium]NDG03827.1 transcription elongation factor GreA [Alphaproteobacteria bacterium]
MTEKVPMTAEGLERLEKELHHLVHSERPAVVKAIAEAREHGDLSENAEYHAARERQSFIEGRVLELEDKISRAEVIDPSKLSGKNIMFGAYVTLVDEDNDDEVVYRLVGQDESDIKLGLLSISSPLARALIGKTVGDSVEVSTPGGTKSYEVLKVSFKKAS